MSMIPFGATKDRRNLEVNLKKVKGGRAKLNLQSNHPLNQTCGSTRSFHCNHSGRRLVSSTLVRQAQLGASYRVPCLRSWAGSPHRAKLNQQPVPSVARSAEPERLAGEQRS